MVPPERPRSSLQHPEVDRSRVAQRVDDRAHDLGQLLFGPEWMPGPAVSDALGQVAELVDPHDDDAFLLKREPASAALGQLECDLPCKLVRQSFLVVARRLISRASNFDEPAI